MTDVHFSREEILEGGRTVRAVGADVVTEADELQTPYARVRDAMRCHVAAEHLCGLVRFPIKCEECLHRLLD
ncbi:MAG: 2-oxoisovalerate dehydrogenase E1 subunit beta [Gammaproteobacteria bacterium]